MHHRWDSCNKWLYLGEPERWVVQFDNWLNWFPERQLTTRSWSLFRVVWDNGAWWGFAFDNGLILDGKKHCKLEGFIEVTILGVGVRWQYGKKVVFDPKALDKFLNETLSKSSQP